MFFLVKDIEDSHGEHSKAQTLRSLFWYAKFKYVCFHDAVSAAFISLDWSFISFLVKDESYQLPKLLMFFS